MQPPRTRSQRHFTFLSFLIILISGAVSLAVPLTIDLRPESPKPKPADFGLGTQTNPSGRQISADGQSILLDNKPWIPIAGEFHYARYPRAEWRDELLKMKAGGINVISTYVFWIHHEEERGQFDWTDRRSLRDFLLLCKDLDLKAIVRMGPWAHGETRNGGFPDWVQNSSTKLRSPDPAFLALVKPFYAQIAEQMKGLLWKDGGPVIGIQVDNECNNLPYLFALKDLARSCGVDVPLYTMTGWNGVRIPTGNLLPLFGGYAIGFWGGNPEDYRKQFVFTPVRDNGDLGAQFTNKRPDRSNNINLFPYLCCEIGGGMMSSYTRRIKVDPDITAAMAMVKLGCGNNMPGYYMYHGGFNPDGKLSYFNEARPNPMPIKDYDFDAPLGACGQVRKQFHLLREQHLFLEDFGSALATMSVAYPPVQPKDIKDFSVLRWSVRSDGNSGFLFFNNRQPAIPLPEHPGVQFAVQTRAGELLVPAHEITIPSGSYGFFPINLDCNGVTLEYATAQPLCRMTVGSDTWYFLAAFQGIDPELSIRHVDGQKLTVLGQSQNADGHDLVKLENPGTGCTAHIEKADGSKVNFVVLTPDQALHLWRAPLAGQPRLILSNATVMQDGDALRLQSDDPANLNAALFPSLGGQRSADAAPDGIFERCFPKPVAIASPLTITIEQKHAATDPNTDLHGTTEAAWDTAADWTFHIPPEAANRRIVLQIHYAADAVRIYSGDHFLDDNYFNGDPFDIALWRIPQDQWPSLHVKVLPMSEKLLKRLPDSVAATYTGPENAAKWNQVTVTAVEQLEAKLESH